MVCAHPAWRQLRWGECAVILRFARMNSINFDEATQAAEVQGALSYGDKPCPDASVGGSPTKVGSSQLA